jgi:hypothetical protein
MAAEMEAIVMDIDVEDHYANYDVDALSGHGPHIPLREAQAVWHWLVHKACPEEVRRTGAAEGVPRHNPPVQAQKWRQWRQWRR